MPAQGLLLTAKLLEPTSAAIAFGGTTGLAVKLRVILREVMEVRNTLNLLCRLTDLWVVLMGAPSLGTYIVKRAGQSRGLSPSG